jgi:hypothetical protein
VATTADLSSQIIAGLQLVVVASGLHVLRSAGKRSTRMYYMPADSDKGVQEVYRHLEKYAPDGIDYYPDALEGDDDVAHKPREVVLDRYGSTRSTARRAWCAAAAQAVGVLLAV